MGCRARTRGGARLAWRRTTFLSCTHRLAREPELPQATAETIDGAGTETLPAAGPPGCRRREWVEARLGIPPALPAAAPPGCRRRGRVRQLAPWLTDTGQSSESP